jgi:phenylacetate-CoA ligase
MNSSAPRKYIQRAEIRDLQEKKLQDILKYLALNSPYYKKIFSQNNIHTDSIRRLEDLILLPTTNKEDLQLYNDEFLCVPGNSVIEYTSTSGTLGSPVTIALTEKDLERLAYNEFKSFTCAGGKPEDVFQYPQTGCRHYPGGTWCTFSAMGNHFEAQANGAGCCPFIYIETDSMGGGSSDRHGFNICKKSNLYW